MRTAVSNRSDFEHPADGWYQIEPIGEHPNTAADCIQAIDDQAVASIVDRFNADAAAGRLSHGAEMLIDHEHFKDVLTEESIAYGWLTALQARKDGMYGQIRWTTTGQAAVDGGDYRFFSTEYDPADLETLSSGNPRRVRPLRLAGLTLTNSPNNKGGKPITNRAGVAAKSAGAAVSVAGAARVVGVLAAADQRAHGGSLTQAYVRVMNRHPQLADAARGKAPGRALRPEAMGDVAEFASRLLDGLAAKEGGQDGARVTWRRIWNQHPRLVRLVNRQTGLDDNLDLEATAKAAYLAGTVNQSDAPEFAAMMERLASLFPSAGRGDLWEQAKELFPRIFWSFVLTFSEK